MRWLAASLGLLFLWLQGYLWLSDSGYRKTRDVREALHLVRSENRELVARNEALAAEVRNLKTGLDAAEERARSDLGMIGPHETFYQVVPPQTDNRN